MKRAVLVLVFGFGFGLTACSSHDGGTPVGGGGGGTSGVGGDGGGSGGRGGGSGTGGGSAVDGGAGDGGAIGDPTTNPPPGGVYPIDHIIIHVKENHTFDNYFGTFPGAEGTQIAQTSTGPVSVGRPPVQLLRDLCHTHECALADWNHGALDHWDLGDSENTSHDQINFAQYIEADIPNYWQYARHFGLADHFFAGMLGPSFPGHLFTLSAQAGWAVGNPVQPTGSIVPLIFWGCDDATGSALSTLDHGTCTIATNTPCFDFPTIVDNLPKGLTWKFYGSALPPAIGEIWSMFDAIQHIRMGAEWQANVVDQSEFDADADAGTLPNISFLVDQDLYSEHPPLNICAGENWTVAHMNHVMANRDLWARTAILMTWDDFGGWYDHVPPPKQYGCDEDQPYGLGFRLPLIVVSPYAKTGVYSRVSNHASIPKFVERVFNLPSLSSQDPAAQDGPGTDDLTAAFDWTQAPLPPLPLTTRSCVGQR